MNALLTIQQKLKAPKSQYNSFGKYNYRSFEDILEAVKPLLAETKAVLTLDDDVICIGPMVFIAATATLKDDQGNTWLTTGYARHAEEVKGMMDSQVTGATSSYARKYALNGLFLIDDTKDADTINDGTKSEKTTTPPPARKEPTNIELPWLNEGTDNWNHIIKRLTDKESPMTLEQVKQAFRISKSSETKLKAL